ncbi:MAG: hypothetical protein AB7I36_14670 [Rhodospirillaceae bacterium]
MRIRTLTFGLALAAAGVHAAPVFADARPPRYDLDGLCNSRATTVEGFSPETKAACVASQSEALDAVRRMWLSTLASIQDDCSYEAKTEGDGDYQVLESCLRTQNRQQQADQAALSRAKAKSKPGLSSK